MPNSLTDRVGKKVAENPWSCAYGFVLLTGLIAVLSHSVIEEAMPVYHDTPREASFASRFADGTGHGVVSGKVAGTDDEIAGKIQEVATLISTAGKKMLSPELYPSLASLVLTSEYLNRRRLNDAVYIAELQTAFLQARLANRRETTVCLFLTALLFSGVLMLHRREVSKGEKIFRAQNSRRLETLNRQTVALVQREAALKAEVDRLVAAKLQEGVNEFSAKEASMKARLLTLQRETTELETKRDSARTDLRVAEQSSDQLKAELEEREAMLTRKQLDLEKREGELEKVRKFNTDAATFVSRIDGFIATYPDLMNFLLKHDPAFSADLASFRAPNP